MSDEIGQGGHHGRVKILFVPDFAPIVADAEAAKAVYRDALGFPLEVVSGDYLAVDEFGGTKRLGVWSLSDAAMSCFGTTEWPSDIPRSLGIS